MKMRWWLKYQGSEKRGNDMVFRYKIHWLYVVWVKTKHIVIEFMTPTPLFREFAKEYPNEFDDICKTLYIHRIIDFLNGLLKK